jgi:hypothetical protein
VPNYVGYSDFESPVEGSEEIAAWLYLVKAPGRIFLDVDLDRM